MTDIELPGFPKLQQQDVYIYDDGPKFFKALGDDGNYYLILLVDEDADGEIYLICRTTKEDIQRMVDAEVSLLATIARGTLYLTDLDTEWEEFSIDRFGAHQLPAADVFFPTRERVEELKTEHGIEE